jgi:hypothetical protein
MIIPTNSGSESAAGAGMTEVAPKYETEFRDQSAKQGQQGLLSLVVGLFSLREGTTSKDRR